MERAFTVLAGVVWALMSGATNACSVSHASRILHDPAHAAGRADLVVRGRVTSQAGAVEDDTPLKMTVAVDRVFKGESRPMLEFRFRYNWCVGQPGSDDPVYLFLSAGQYSLTNMNYVMASRVPANFEARLGIARPPTTTGTPTVLSHPVPRLAPESIAASSVTRAEAEIVTESWSASSAPVQHWAIPRFYVRYPDAFVFFEEKDVRAAAAQWRDADLVRGVLGALPLKTPMDLYQFTLMGRYPRGSSPELETLAAETLLSGRAIVFTSQGYLSEIRVTRTSLGEQRFSFGDPQRVFLVTRFALPDPPTIRIQQ